MSDVTFREKYEWTVTHVEVRAFALDADAIERVYDEAHTPKVTADEVAGKWLDAARRNEPSKRAPVAEWESINALRAALYHGAGLEADRCNAEKGEPESDAWIFGATDEIVGMIYSGESGAVGGWRKRISECLRTAYSARGDA